MKMNLNQLCESHGLPVVEPAGGPRCFRVIRFRRGGFGGRTIKSHLTEAEAQAHCSRNDTRGPGWFDGYDYMKGCRP
jgi:hypothetical protein